MIHGDACFAYFNKIWGIPDRTHDGRKYQMLNVLDEFTRECLAICPIARSRTSTSWRASRTCPTNCGTGEVFYTVREAQVRSDTNHQFRRCSSQPLPGGRLRYAHRLTLAPAQTLN
jgi:hypothetical protein